MDEKLAKFDPWARPRPAAMREVVDLPDSGLSLEFVEGNVISASRASSEAESLIEAHITGDGVTLADPLRFDGRVVELEKSFVQQVCLVRAAQPESERCGFVWWVGLALNYEDDYLLCIKAVARLNKKGAEKN